jgi:hypothetical protein
MDSIYMAHDRNCEFSDSIQDGDFDYLSNY